MTEIIKLLYNKLEELGENGRDWVITEENGEVEITKNNEVLYARMNHDSCWHKNLGDPKNKEIITKLKKEYYKAKD